MSSTFSFIKFVFYSVVVLVLIDFSLASKRSKCDTCRTFAKNFKKGIKNTLKYNFGGGNTNWEERKLGKYLKSETRLIEILEYSCEEGEKAKCHSLVEETEELIENWWFEIYHADDDDDDDEDDDGEDDDDRKKNLEHFLCIDTLKICCNNGTYGKKCEECKGGASNPCGGRGICKDSGYRDGTGKCTCNEGYVGEVCHNCADGFYAGNVEYYKDDDDDDEGDDDDDDDDDRKVKSITCLACPSSCANKCTSGDSVTCDECKEGWRRDEDGRCVDINECNDATKCPPHQFCANEAGSYQCVDCDKACEGCDGGGDDHCNSCAAKFYEKDGRCLACHSACHSSCTDSSPSSCDSCAPGWQASELGCQDVDECESNTHNCTPSQYCSNTLGSFECIPCKSPCNGCTSELICQSCEEGWSLIDGVCQDVDECEAAEACKDVNEVCVNKKGSFSCVCKEGYVRRNDSPCFKKNIPVKKTKKGKKEEALSEEEAKRKMTKTQYADVQQVTAGPNGFNKEDISKLGDPMQPEEDEYIKMEGSFKKESGSKKDGKDEL